MSSQPIFWRYHAHRETRDWHLKTGNSSCTAKNSADENSPGPRAVRIEGRESEIAQASTAVQPRSGDGWRGDLDRSWTTGGENSWNRLYFMYMCVWFFHLHVYKCLHSSININLLLGLEHSSFSNDMVSGIEQAKTFASLSFPKVNQI